MTSRAYQKNSKYYESTLQKLIDKLFQQENDEEEDGPEDKTAINLFNRSQQSILTKVKKEFFVRGQYQEMD